MTDTRTHWSDPGIPGSDKKWAELKAKQDSRCENKMSKNLCALFDFLPSFCSNFWSKYFLAFKAYFPFDCFLQLRSKSFIRSWTGSCRAFCQTSRLQFCQGNFLKHQDYKELCQTPRLQETFSNIKITILWRKLSHPNQNLSQSLKMTSDMF